MSALDPRLWLLVIGLCAASFVGGCMEQKRNQKADQVDAVQEARETENELQRLQNRWTSDYIDQMLKQQEHAHALPKITLVHDCPVPAAVGRVLNDAERVPDDARAGPGAGAAGAETDSTCAAELDIAKRNYAEVCIPNAEQLTALQQRWNNVRQKLLDSQGSR